MRSLDLGRRFGGIVAWDSFFHLTADEQRALIPRLAGHLAPGRRLALHRRPATPARPGAASAARRSATRASRPPATPRRSRRAASFSAAFSPRIPTAPAAASGWPAAGVGRGIGHRRASAPPPEPGHRRVSVGPETWPVAPSCRGSPGGCAGKAALDWLEWRQRPAPERKSGRSEAVTGQFPMTEMVFGTAPGGRPIRFFRAGGAPWTDGRSPASSGSSPSASFSASRPRCRWPRRTTSTPSTTSSARRSSAGSASS